MQSQGAFVHTWVLLCWEKLKKKTQKTAGEGVEGLGVLIAFALQLAEDKCHRAGSLLEATCTMATSAALCPWNKPLAVPSARSRCLEPQHHRVKRGMLRPGGLPRLKGRLGARQERLPTAPSSGLGLPSAPVPEGPGPPVRRAGGCGPPAARGRGGARRGREARP